MSASGYHLVLHLSDDRIVAPHGEARRVVARVALDIGALFHLMAFRCADRDLHLLAASDRRDAGELARRVEIALQQRLIFGAVGFDPARIRAVADRGQLKRAFHRVLASVPRAARDPYHDASNLPDLLGLRLIGAHTVPRLRARLPTVRRSQLLAHLGIAQLDESTRPSGDDILAATRRAAALEQLGGRSRDVADARAAAVRVADDHLTTARIAELLAVDGRTIRRLRSRSIDPRLERAVRLQLALRYALPRAEVS